MTASHPIALPAALLLAVASLAWAVAAACAFLLIAIVVVAGHGGVALHDGAWAGWCGAAACACASVATLIALTRASGGLRPLALGGAWAVAFAWPLSGVLPAAAAATLATALLVRWGGGGARIRRFDVPAAAVLAVATVALFGAAFGGAPVGAARELPARTAAARVAGPDTGRPGGEGSRTDAHRAARTRTDAQPAAGTRTDAHRAAGTRTDAQSAGGSRTYGATGAPPASSPAAMVRGYYRALDRRDFAGAWRLLSPAVRAGFGGFDRWRAGFAATLSSQPTALRVEGRNVELLLVARDRAPCGVLEQRFAVRWDLQPTPAGQRATALTARRVAPPACAP